MTRKELEDLLALELERERLSAGVTVIATNRLISLIRLALQSIWDAERALTRARLTDELAHREQKHKKEQAEREARNAEAVARWQAEEAARAAR